MPEVRSLHKRSLNLKKLDNLDLVLKTTLSLQAGNVLLFMPYMVIFICFRLLFNDILRHHCVIIFFLYKRTFYKKLCTLIMSECHSKRQFQNKTRMCP